MNLSDAKVARRHHGPASRRAPSGRRSLARAGLVIVAVAATLFDRSTNTRLRTRQASDPPATLAGSWHSVANGDRVNALYRDGDSLWVAADAGGLVQWSIAAGTYRQHLHPQSPLPDNTVYDVAPALGGGVWAATARGLVRYVPEREQWQVVTPATSPGMPARRVTAVAPLSDGTLWVGFAQEWDPALHHPASTDGSVLGAFRPGGIARFDPSQNAWSSASHAELTSVPGDPSDDPKFKTLPSDNVTDLALDSDGALWVATRPYYAWDASTCHEPDCLKRSEFWVLTGGGLAARKGDVWRRWYPTFDTDTSCYDRTVTALAADADGRVWAGTQGHGVLLMRGYMQAWSCSSGQAYYTKPRGRPDPKIPGLAGNVVRALAVEAGTGRVWLSQGEGIDVGLGVTILDPKGTYDDSPGSPSAFNSDDVYTPITVGATAVRDRRISAIDLSLGAVFGTVDEHNGDGDGVWFGTPNATVPSGWTWEVRRTADNGLPSNQVTGVADNAAGRTTWFALKNRGVARWRRDTDDWTWWTAYREQQTVTSVHDAGLKGAAKLSVGIASAETFATRFPEADDFVRVGLDKTVYRVTGFTPTGDGQSGLLDIAPPLAGDAAVGLAVVRLSRGPAGNRSTQITLRNGAEPWVSALRNDALFQMSGDPPSCPDYPDCWLDGGVAGLGDTWPLKFPQWQVYDPHNSPLDYREAVAVEADPAGRVWIAVGDLVATGFGLAVLDPATGAWREHQVTADFNAGNGVADIAVDPTTGHVWTAHYPVERKVQIAPGRPEEIVVAGGGVARWDGTRWKSWTKKDSGSTMAAYGDYGVYSAVAIDRARGRVWAGGWSTIGNTFHWPRGENVNAQLDACPLETCRARDWTGKRWLNDGLVSALAVDGLGRVWVGTHRYHRGVVPPVGGVKLLVGDVWHQLSPDDSGLPSNQIAAIDARGSSVWLATLRDGAAVYDEAIVPTPTPTLFVPTAAPTLTPTRTPTPSATPSATPSPTDAAGGTPSATAGSSPTALATDEATPDPRRSPSASATGTAPTPTTPERTETPTPPASPTRTPTADERCGADRRCKVWLPSLWRYNRRR